MELCAVYKKAGNKIIKNPLPAFLQIFKEYQMNARNNTHSFLFTYTVYHIQARLSIPFMQFVHIAVFCIVFYFNLYKY